LFKKNRWGEDVFPSYNKAGSEEERAAMY